MCIRDRIQLYYYDIKGKKVEASLTTLISLLQVMGIEDLSETGLEEKIREKEEEKNNPFPPVVVTSERKLRFGPLSPQKVVLMVKGEKGEEWREEFNIEEHSFLEWDFPPSMEWGYYELTFLPVSYTHLFWAKSRSFRSSRSTSLYLVISME